MTASVVNDFDPARCSVKTPQASWTVVNVGNVSILFSYGLPAGVDTGKEVFVKSSKRSTVKHLNTWRDFRRQIELPELDFNLALMEALHTESQFIYQNLPKQEYK